MFISPSKERHSTIVYYTWRSMCCWPPHWHVASPPTPLLLPMLQVSHQYVKIGWYSFRRNVSAKILPDCRACIHVYAQTNRMTDTVYSVLIEIEKIERKKYRHGGIFDIRSSLAGRPLTLSRKADEYTRTDADNWPLAFVHPADRVSPQRAQFLRISCA